MASLKGKISVAANCPECKMRMAVEFLDEGLEWPVITCLTEGCGYYKRSFELPDTVISEVNLEERPGKEES